MIQHIVGYKVKAVAVPSMGHALSRYYSHDNYMRVFEGWKRSAERTKMYAIAYGWRLGSGLSLTGILKFWGVLGGFDTASTRCDRSSEAASKICERWQYT